MGADLYLYTIPADVVKEQLPEALDGKAIDDSAVHEARINAVCFWISPRWGFVMDGVEKHMPGVYSREGAFIVTKEQLLGMVDVSREYILSPKEAFEDYTIAHCQKCYNRLVEKLETVDFDKEYIFGFYS